MKKSYSITLVFLIILTGMTALFSLKLNTYKYVSIVILILSIIKFLVVVFQFMDLKKAHVFWKASIITFLIIFSTIIMIFIS